MNGFPPAAAPPLTCPVCRARFRGVSACSRCGTDLTLPMRAAARAWAAREQGRAALQAGNLHRALRLIARAEQLHGVGSASELQ
jgi:hypothetical protein